MKVFRSTSEAANARLLRPVVTLGVFDGVHVGHRFILDHVMALARERAADSVVVTFDLHPRAVISGEAPKLITSLPHRLRIFEQLGIGAALVLHFDDELRQMEARDFAQHVFAETLRAELVVLGYNNRFGRGGKGDINVLRAVGALHGFEARQLEEVRVGAETISSTAIRGAILSGDLERASLMLGRPFSVLGTVMHGDGIGQTLGFPTANLDLHHEVRPPRGVYGCEVDFQGGRAFGIVNIGIRPTVRGASLPAGSTADAWEARDRHERIEVHLLDFAGDLYGQDIEMLFLIRIRDEVRFAGLERLREQIARDEAFFRHWLSTGLPARSSGPR